MAHDEQVAFCLSVKQQLPHYFRDVFVLDVGALDINGNNQYLFEDSYYLGADLAEGRNVDIISPGGDLKFPDASFDVIISTECFEHDKHYSETLKNIYRMLKPGGLFLFTCATEGRPEHGTRRTSPSDAPLLCKYGDWQDYYQNLKEGDIREVFDPEKQFSSFEFSVNDSTHDLYFWGIKTGTFIKPDDYSFRVARPALHRILKQGDEITRLSVDVATLTHIKKDLKRKNDELEVLLQSKLRELSVLRNRLAVRIYLGVIHWPRDVLRTMRLVAKSKK